MRKLCIIFLLACISQGWSQADNRNKLRFGLKFGYTIHTITGGRVKTQAKDYFQGGAWLQLKLSKHWTTQTEILFVEKGTGGSRSNYPKIGEYWVGLYYFEVPLLFQYHHKKMSYEFGPGLGVLVYGHENLYGSLLPDMTEDYPFDKKEISFNAGIGIMFNAKWSAGLRFTHSLMPVRKQLPGISEQVFNRLLALQVSRLLNVKKRKSETEDNL